MDVTGELETVLHDLRGMIHRLSSVERQQLSRHGDTLAEMLRQGDDFQKGFVLPSNPILDRLPFHLAKANQPLSGLLVEWESAGSTRLEHNTAELDAIQNYALPRLIDQFLDLFFYGNSRAAGLHQLIPPEYTRHSGSATGTCLSFSHFISLVESLRTPELVISSPRVSTLVEHYLYQTGQIASPEWPEGPVGVAQCKGIPWDSTAAIRDTETAVKGAYAEPTGGSCSSIFVLDFDGIKGIQDHKGIQYWHSDNGRSRLVWHVGVILPQLRSCGKIDGILTHYAVVG